VETRKANRLFVGLLAVVGDKDIAEPRRAARHRATAGKRRNGNVAGLIFAVTLAAPLVAASPPYQANIETEGGALKFSGIRITSSGADCFSGRLENSTDREWKGLKFDAQIFGKTASGTVVAFIVKVQIDNPLGAWDRTDKLQSDCPESRSPVETTAVRLRFTGGTSARDQSEAAKERANALAAAARKRAAAVSASEAVEAQRRAEERSRLRKSCAAIYTTTIDKKVGELTVREEQQVRACQVLGLYPPS
jgi:hypothetical protein